MITALIAFALGVFFAPVIRPLLRPVFVEIIKLSLMTAEEVRRLSVQVREDIEDAAAEANAERAKQKAQAGRQSEPTPTGSASSTGSTIS